MRLLLCLMILIWVNHSMLAQQVEAESGQLVGTSVESTASGFSGSGYVTGFDQDGDAVTMEVNIETNGTYRIIFGYRGPYGEKTNDIYINGSFAGSAIFPARNSFGEITFGNLYLYAGSNKIKVLKNWGYFELDYVRCEASVPNEIHHYPEDLINPEATSEAKVIYQFIRDYYGHRIISGQQAGDGEDEEFDYLMEKTGKIPAIKGFDLIDYSPSRVERGTTSNQTEYALDWWQEGGVVSLMWHWNAPKDLIDNQEAPWWSGFYTYATNFDHTIAMNDQGSEEYELIIRDIDVIAEELKELSDGDTPVLWRPLHEAEGGWFWWGSKGPDACKWLWQLMYDRLTNYHELHNLIWVWTGTSSPDELSWYPGDEYVDLIGADIYLDDKNYATSFTMFDAMVGLYNGERIITLSETGTIPDPQLLERDKARWSWFMTWSGNFIMDGVKNEVLHLNSVFNHDYVITFDELPDFSNYVSPEFPDEEVVTHSKFSDRIKVYPNPTAHELTIDTEESPQLVRIIDLKGNIIELPVDGSSISLENLGPGVYVLHIHFKSGMESIKIIKR